MFCWETFVVDPVDILPHGNDTPWWKCKSLHDSVSLAHCKNCSWMAPGKWKRAQGIALTYEISQIDQIEHAWETPEQIRFMEAYLSTTGVKGSATSASARVKSSKDSGGLYENVLVRPTDAPSDWCLGYLMVRSGAQGQFLQPFLNRFCCVTGHIVLLEDHCHQVMLLPWHSVHGLQ